MDHTQPLVSIAMPVFDAARTLPATLCSIRLQTYQHWELLLIDDGSSDGTLDLAHAAARADARIRVIEGVGNLGLAARLNEAIALARGHYIARLDADDIAYPTRLAIQLKFMLDNPECDLLGCAALIFDDAGRMHGKWSAPQTHAALCARPWSRIPLPHPTWFGKRQWFVRYGYRPDYKKTQDQDLLLRAYAHSRFACVPEILLGYRQEQRSLSKLLAGRRNFSRSVMREAWQQGVILAGLGGLGGQLGKAVLDVLTVPFGWDRLLRGESATTLKPDEERAWRSVWKAVSSGSS